MKRVTPLEWAGIGAGALAFIVSFFPWYSISYSGPTLPGFSAFSGGASASAWGVGIGGWLPVLMLIAAGVIVLLPHLGTAVPNGGLIWLGLSAGALVIILIRWLTLPGEDGFGISQGAGFGIFIGLLAALVSGVAAFLTYRSASTRATA
ncbi:MAG: hypothetical protein ACJ72N_21340 [Labedaea sp.]